MQNTCIAFEAICQRALRPLFTALCPVLASEAAWNSKERALSGFISDLYFCQEPVGRCGRRKGAATQIESLPQAIKMTYSVNATLIQSQLLILNHFFGRVYFMDGVKVMAR